MASTLFIESKDVLLITYLCNKSGYAFTFSCNQELASMECHLCGYEYFPASFHLMLYQSSSSQIFYFNYYAHGIPS